MLKHYDVVVVGAGPAGIAAAWASNVNGMQTALVERYGFCGGTASIAGVSVYANQPAGSHDIAGITFQNFSLNLLKDHAAYRAGKDKSWFVVNTEHSKRYFDQLLTAAGVDIYYHSVAFATRCSINRIESISILGHGGTTTDLSAEIFIDCTGNADLAILANLPVDQTDKSKCQPMTTIYHVGPVNIEKAIKGGATSVDNRFLWWGDENENLLKYVEHARSENKWPLPKRCFSIMWSDPLCPMLVGVNGTRISNHSALDSLDISQAEIEGRRQAQLAAEFMSNYLPGFENSRLIMTGPQIGIRETRRIKGLYELNEHDVITAHQFEDQIAQGAYGIDLHLPNSETTDLRELPKGSSYGIPYRCLLSSGATNYLAAGRLISATSLAASSLRVMPICMTVGEAAGLAASLSIKCKANTHELDPALLKSELNNFRSKNSIASI